MNKSSTFRGSDGECVNCQRIGGASIAGAGLYAILRRRTIAGKYGPLTGWVMGTALIGTGAFLGLSTISYVRNPPLSIKPP